MCEIISEKSLPFKTKKKWLFSLCFFSLISKHCRQILGFVFWKSSCSSMPVFLMQTDNSLLEILFLDTNYDAGQCYGIYIHPMDSLCTIRERNTQSDQLTFSERIKILNQKPLCVSADAKQ